MRIVAYASPYVPPEWIAAFGLQPRWFAPPSLRAGPARVSGRGVCPYAGAVVEQAAAGLGADALVLSTACDQMRYAAAWIEHRRDLPVFLLNVPSTWRSAAVDLYRDELERLGRFLVAAGGSPPDTPTLVHVILQYDAARRAVRQARCRLSPREYARAIHQARHGPNPHLCPEHGAASAAGNVRLALLGGPLSGPDHPLYDAVDRAGGRIVLDGTEMGERTLPPPLDPARVQPQPLETLAEAYGRLPDVFRRPNHAFYQWLEKHLAARQAQGILLWRYVGCDLWHAERERIRRLSPVPLLEIDAWQDGADEGRIHGRIEAFLETLRAPAADTGATGNPPGRPAAPSGGTQTTTH